MKKEGLGMEGKRLWTGADILVKTALSNEFPDASGQYVDNGSGRFTNSHTNAMNQDKVATVTKVIEEIVAAYA